MRKILALDLTLADATNFDELNVNRNFSYDYTAYCEVKSNLSRLIELGELHLLMDPRLELMQQERRVPDVEPGLWLTRLTREWCCELCLAPAYPWRSGAST